MGATWRAQSTGRRGVVKKGASPSKKRWSFPGRWIQSCYPYKLIALSNFAHQAEETLREERGGK